MRYPTSIDAIGGIACVGLVSLCIAIGFGFGAEWGFASFGGVCLFLSILGAKYEGVIRKLREQW